MCCSAGASSVSAATSVAKSAALELGGGMNARGGGTGVGDGVPAAAANAYATGGMATAGAATAGVATAGAGPVARLGGLERLEVVVGGSVTGAGAAAQVPSCCITRSCRPPQVVDTSGRTTDIIFETSVPVAEEMSPVTSVPHKHAAAFSEPSDEQQLCMSAVLMPPSAAATEAVPASTVCTALRGAEHWLASWITCCTHDAAPAPPANANSAADANTARSMESARLWSSATMTATASEGDTTDFTMQSSNSEVQALPRRSVRT